MSDDGSAYQTRVNRVIEHIRTHLAGNLTLADLACVAGPHGIPELWKRFVRWIEAHGTAERP